MKRILILSSLLFTTVLGHAQQYDSVNLTFDFRFNGKKLDSGIPYRWNNSFIIFSKCKFYISNFHQRLNGTDSPQKNYHLIDLSDPMTWTVNLYNDQSIHRLANFSLGIDSTTSVSGVFGGDLDPTNGMYWSWQSGYINIKIEGSSPICPARKNKFQFHIGGYTTPYNASRKVNLGTKYDGRNLIVVLDLDRFFESIDLSTDYQIMSPGKKAMQLSDIFAKCFSGYEK